MTATAPDLRRIERLSAVSARQVREPEVEFDWPTLGAGRILPDELLSIAGLDLDLSPEQRATLSREEVASMLAGGIRFEAVLDAAFSLQLAHARELDDPRHVYMLHEVGEETRHQRAFLRLREQIQPTAENPLDHRALAFVIRRAIAVILRNPALFCVMLLAGEEIPDLLQKLASEHPETDPLLRAVNKYHRAEEARHLAFARLTLAEQWAQAGHSSARACVTLRPGSSRCSSRAWCTRACTERWDYPVSKRGRRRTARPSDSPSATALRARSSTLSATRGSCAGAASRGAGARCAVPTVTAGPSRRQSARSTINGAWSEGPEPFRALRSTTAKRTRSATGSVASARSMRMPRCWWKSPAR
jgi:hypothetical protein